MTQPCPPSSSSSLMPVVDERMGLVLPVGALSAVIQAWTIFMHKRALRRVERHVIRYAPMLMREQKRITNLNCIYNYNDTEALWMLRMKRAPFARLVQTFRTRRLLEDSIHTSVEEQVAMFLHIAGHNQKFRVIHNTFKWSVETISRYFKQVLYAVGELRGEMVKSPTGRTPTKILTSPR
ncbi:hypothetical protein VPH35_101780 [Triticum aestivum]